MTRRRLVVAGVYAVIIVGGWVLGHWASQWSIMDLRSSDEGNVRQMVLVVSALFVVTAALPFVPGAEIGFALIAIFGSRIIPLVYVCMLSALIVAYCIGRFVPLNVLASIFGFVGMERSGRMVGLFARMSPDDRLRAMVERSPSRWIPFLIRHRYLALAIALNVPGNTLLGGGGGLSLAAGMSGLFSFGRTMLTFALAVAPVPFVILMIGYQP